MIDLLLTLLLLADGTPDTEAPPLAMDTAREAEPNAPASADVTELPVELRVRVLRGRAGYVLPEGGDVAWLRPASPQLRTDAGIYLELEMSSQAELIWIGVGSVRLDGPATLSWNAGPPVVLLPAEDAETRTEPLTILEHFRAQKRRLITERPRADRPIELVFGSFRSCELEARLPGFEVEAEAHGWKLEIPTGALHLESRLDGDLRVAHHGGQPVRVRTRRLRPPGTWPVRIRPGARLDLPVALERPSLSVPTGISESER